jgi:hypothetical protein
MTIHTTGDLIRDYLRYNFPGQYVVVIKMNDSRYLHNLLTKTFSYPLNAEQYVDAMHFGYVLIACESESQAFKIFDEFPCSAGYARVFGPDVPGVNAKDRTEGCFLTEN